MKQFVIENINNMLCVPAAIALSLAFDISFFGAVFFTFCASLAVDAVLAVVRRRPRAVRRMADGSYLIDGEVVK